MKKPLLICAATALCFYLSAANAQTDTTRYDLGRIQLHKNLTQAITIKAADLERMPFSSLSEAINVWLYGVYGGQTSYVPVIDGVTMTDVNALSIYDIDEITLVQNASTGLNGTGGPQQLVLIIKTRRNRPGSRGIEAAGQTNVINLHMEPVPANAGYTAKSSTQFYNQYYLSGYVNKANLHAGLSADYQRDAYPVEKDKSTDNGQQYNYGLTQALSRYKFNGYLDASVGKSVLSVSTGYVSQNGNERNESENITGNGYLLQQSLDNMKQNLYYVNASLKSSFSSFKNTLTGAYEHYKTTQHEDNLTGAYFYDDYYGNQYQSVHYTPVIGTSANNYVLKDNLSGNFKSGNWSFEPNLNLMYQHYKAENTNIGHYVSNIDSLEIATDSTSNSTTQQVQNILTLTPALSISYHDVLGVQGGFETVLSNSLNQNKPKKFYPFISAGWNVTGTDTAKKSFGLRFFGSYAKVASYEMAAYGNMSLLNVASTFNATLPLASFNAVNPNVNPYAASNQWQFGATVGLWKNKLIFNYSYNSTKYMSSRTSTYIVPSNGTLAQYTINYNTPNKLTINRFGFDINWFKTDKLPGKPI